MTLREFTYSMTTESPDGTSGNQTPIGWREITEAEYSHSMGFCYHPKFVEYRQFMPPGEKYYLSGNLEWFHDGTGTCMISDHQNSKLRFFQFGCDHKYRAPTPEEWKEHDLHGGNCIHNYICDKCGNIDTQDSSD